LARSFAAGDAEVLRTVRGWIEPVVRYRSWRFRDPVDITHVVALRLVTLVRARKFRGESKFRTFVHSVATHTCIDAYRRQKRLQSRERPADDPDRNPSGDSPEQALAEQDRFRVLAYLYQRLTDECRSLWRLVYVEHRSAAQVAETLEISENAARVRVHRCLERARKLAASMQSAAMPDAGGSTA